MRHARDVQPPLALLPILAVLVLLVTVHLVCLTAYGWFRDELYYLVCADNLAWGYVDQPPFSIGALALWRSVFGESLAAVRVPGVLLGAASALITAMLAREFGGRAWAQGLAALTVAVAPAMLGTVHFYSMNAWDLALWGLAYLAITRALSTGTTTAWLLFGVTLGVGLLNKLSVLWLIGGLGIGLLLSSQRRVLASPGPWLAGAVAAALFAPHILWQVQHQWPTLEFMRNATDLKMAASGALEFMVKQLLGMISSDLVWLVGLGWLLIARRSRPWRLFGFAYVAIALLLMASGRSRAGYLTPAYLPLLAGGATALESFSGRRGWRWTRFALPLLMLALSARIAPLALPLLPVERYLAYARSMGVAPSTEERKQMGPLPQHFADMHGWHELEALVDSTYRGLTTEERTHCAVVARNYGEAGAVTVLGRRDGLPRAVSGHNNFWLWGPGNADGRVMIVIGGGEGEQHEQFESVEMIGRWNAPYAMPYEQNRVIWLCRGLKRPLSEWWAERKSYD